MHRRYYANRHFWTPAPPEDGTNLISITHASSDVSEMVAALDEQFKYLRAFCRGLDENEYQVTLYDYARDRQIYTEHSSIGTLSLQKKSDQYPLIFIDEELIKNWSGQALIQLPMNSPISLKSDAVTMMTVQTVVA